MIRKLKTGEYRLYSRKKNPKTERGGILEHSPPGVRPRRMRKRCNTLNTTSARTLLAQRSSSKGVRAGNGGKKPA